MGRQDNAGFCGFLLLLLYSVFLCCWTIQIKGSCSFKKEDFKLMPLNKSKVIYQEIVNKQPFANLKLHILEYISNNWLLFMSCLFYHQV